MKNKKTQTKVAIITGSTSGIGLVIAEHLAAINYHIILNGFGDAAVIAQQRAHLTDKYQVKVEFSPADVTNINQVTELFDLANKHGGVDVLINNAGCQFVAPIDEFPVDKWQSIIETNLIAAFYTTRLAIPTMKRKKWGRVINIASAHGLVASPFKSAYVAAKHGLIGLTKSVALEVAEHNITVNAICPGYVETALVLNQVAATAKVRNITEQEVIQNVLLGQQSTKKFISAAEIARMIVFLCKNDMPSMTGAAISIDGGWTAH